jgi:hypothetical protein
VFTSELFIPDIASFSFRILDVAWASIALILLIAFTSSVSWLFALLLSVMLPGQFYFNQRRDRKLWSDQRRARKLWFNQRRKRLLLCQLFQRI